MIRRWFSSETRQNEPKIAGEGEKMIFEQEQMAKEASEMVFGSYKIYNIRQNPLQLKKRFYYMALGSVIQVSGTSALFYFGHPFIGIFFLWLASGQVLKTGLVFFNSRKLITRIDLLEDRLHVRIYFDLRKQDYSIVVPITKIRLLHTSDHMGLSRFSRRKLTPEEEQKAANRFYSILDVTDVKGANYTGLSVAVNPENKIENMEIFQDIMTGNPSKMESYVYVERKEEPKQTDAETKK